MYRTHGQNTTPGPEPAYGPSQSGLKEKEHQKSPVKNSKIQLDADQTLCVLYWLYCRGG